METIVTSEALRTFLLLYFYACYLFILVFLWRLDLKIEKALNKRFTAGLDLKKNKTNLYKSRKGY